jgi:serine-type D-Ala-D-Ala carboxypeptidase (penicillin-binding protein 5/6)
VRAAPVGLGLGLLALAIVAGLALSRGGDASPRRAIPTPTPTPAGGVLDIGTAPTPLALRLGDPHDVVRDSFTKPPRAGVVFDLDTGQVLWRRRPTRRLPIASLTKMMTALVVTDRVPERAKVRISSKALRYSGSGVGLLPRGKRVGVSALLHGLLLPSGNDAARALAEGAGGSIAGFIRLMNERASAMGLTCTRFTSVDGLRDRGNFSCPADLAALARAVLREPRLARIVARPSAVIPYPGKGRRLYLYNHNPLLRNGYRGTVGVKTGYTNAAGRCFVAAVRRGGVGIGVVLLHSPDPARQARQLLDRAFRETLAGT